MYFQKGQITLKVGDKDVDLIRKRSRNVQTVEDIGTITRRLKAGVTIKDTIGRQIKKQL